MGKPVYASAMPTLQDLCRLVDGDLHGDGDVAIDGVGSLEGAVPGDIAAIDSSPYLKVARASQAGAFLTKAAIAAAIDRPCIVHEFPLVALNAIMRALGFVRAQPTGVDATAILAGDVHETVVAGPFVHVQADARVGARTVLHAHTVVESGAVVGEDCILEPGVVLHDGALIGDRVRIGAHAVISRQGFGFTVGPKGPVQLHHIGRVVVEDDVTIGAGTMVDRARFDETRIGARSNLDNLVHVGHNCTIGKRSFLAAQVGLAGMAHIGDDCLVGGQVGFANGTGVGNGSRVGAQAGLMRRWPEKSDLLWSPAAPRKIILRKLSQFIRG